MAKDWQSLLSKKLEFPSITSDILLGKCRIPKGADSDAFKDPSYLPFYYHLGTMIKSKKVIEMGFNIGLLSNCFLQGCKTVERYVGFREKNKEYYSPLIGTHNVRDVYKGDFEIIDETKDTKFDLIIFGEEIPEDKLKKYTLLFWEQLPSEGLLIIDYIFSNSQNNTNFIKICKLLNREPFVFDTRYGVGIIER